MAKNHKLFYSDPKQEWQTVEQVGRDCNVDLSSVKPDELNYFDRDVFRSLVANTLLFGCHPSIQSAIERIRTEVGMRMVEYPWEAANIGDKILEVIEKNPEAKDPEKLFSLTEAFFNREGRNFPTNIWSQLVDIKIMTDVLPLPAYFQPISLQNFRNGYLREITKINAIIDEKERLQAFSIFVSRSYAHNIATIPFQYPIAIFTKKIKGDTLVKWAKSKRKEIEVATKDLPRQPINNKGVDLGALALGLFALKHEEMSLQELKDYVVKKSRAIPNFLPLFEELKTVDITEFKSQALKKLSKISSF